MTDTQRTDAEALRPCPFCGGFAEFGCTNSGGHYVQCEACGASTALRFACGDDPLPLLAEAWNERAALPASRTDGRESARLVEIRERAQTMPLEEWIEAGIAADVFTLLSEVERLEAENKRLRTLLGDARTLIQEERDGIVESSSVMDRATGKPMPETMDDVDAAYVAEFDAFLARIDAALAHQEHGNG